MPDGDDGLSRFLSNFSELSRTGLDYEKFVQRFNAEVQNSFGIDKVVTKIFTGKKDMLAVEEFALNTNKPYIDNRLSQYSSFPELINYFQSGFRSCLIVPILVNNRPICTTTMLSGKEERFAQGYVNGLTIAATLLGYYIATAMESEKSLGLARYFDASFDTIVPQMLLDRKGLLIKVNKAFLNAANMSQADLVGRNVNGILSMDYNMIQSLRSGKFAETSIIGNEARRFRITSKDVSDTVLYAMLYETTQLSQMDDIVNALRNSEGEMLMLLDQNGKITWVSDNSEKVIKYPKSSILGMNVSKFTTGKTDLIANASASKGIYSDMIRVYIDSSTFVDAKILIFRNSSGFSCLLSSSNKDTVLKNLRENFNDVIQLSNDAVIEINELGYVKSMNEGAEKILGYKNADIKDKSVFVLCNDQQNQKVLENAISMARQIPKLSNIEITMATKTERGAIPFSLSIKRMLDDYNNLNGYLIIAKEMWTSGRLESYEDEISRINRDMDKVEDESDMKTQFIYNISHDLKTPITNIKGFASLLYSGEFGQMTEEQRNYLKIIIDESDRFTQLILQILDVARLSSGRIKLDRQEVDFNTLKENPSLKAIEQAAKDSKKDIEFVWKIDENVPMISADPNRLIQVFANLIGNAVKFTEHGSITVYITRKGRNVRVEVRDTGIGISKEDQGKLFKKFFQVQRKGLVMQEGKGTGLGLSIVSEIVGMHGGRKGLTSELGKGSTFWFTLPISGKKKQKERQEQDRPQLVRVEEQKKDVGQEKGAEAEKTAD